MGTKDLVLGGAIAILGGAAAYFYMQSGPVIPNPPSFGKLAGVNRIVLATHDYSDKCTHKDDQGLGQGEIQFGWDFEFGYGVDIPPNWNWQVVYDETNSSYEVALPALKQLHPLKVQFSETIEIDPANGNRWERMIKFATLAAHKRMARAVGAVLNADDKVQNLALAKAEGFLKPLLQQAAPDRTVNSVVVTFAAGQSSPLGLDTSPDC